MVGLLELLSVFREVVLVEALIYKRLNMCDIAYHMEALRRQRVIERKRSALERIADKEDELQTLRQEQREREKKIVSEQEQANAKERDYYLKTMARMGKSEKHSNPEAKYIGMIKERQNGINRNDLRHQARELRDSCLYMGPVNEYFMA